MVRLWICRESADYGHHRYKMEAALVAIFRRRPKSFFNAIALRGRSRTITMNLYEKTYSDSFDLPFGREPCERAAFGRG